MYDRILISTDGSELAQKGLDHGLALAKALGAKAIVVTVIERFPVYAGFDSGITAVGFDEYMSGQRESAAKVLAAAKASAAAQGLEAETVCAEDAIPADTIVDTAKSRDCGLIVMSSHGRRGLSRLLLGSVATEVLTRSPVPVLVVR